jgi:transcriptional regulator with PAS, ATPase and Fis domain
MGAKSATPRRWQRLLEDAGEAIVLLDRHLRIVFVNASAEQLLGADAHDLLGLTCRLGRSSAAADHRAALADILSVPAAVNHGEVCQTRRMIPSSHRALDIDFFPLSSDGQRSGLMAWLRAAGPAIDVPIDGSSVKLVELAGASDRRYDLRHFPASSRLARRVADRVRLASRLDSPVLFRGEKGTGKSWLARTVHQLSPSRDGPWLHLDCESLPATAVSRALASLVHLPGPQPATVYLDQVHRLPRELQAEVAAWRHASGASPRVMAGTHADLSPADAKADVLDDLAEWLGLFEISVPPLRERTEDLPAWLDELGQRLGFVDQGQGLHLADTAKSLLLEYPWPGNLDEMLLVLEEIGPITGTLEPQQLPARLRCAVKMAGVEEPPADRRIDLDQVLAEVEKRLLNQALTKTRGNKSRAADLLGIWRARLIRRMQALGMSVEDEGAANGSESPDSSEETSPECAPDN